MIISHIVAIANDFAIGQENDLLFRLSSDLKQFRLLTTGHHILLGRKNFESIGRPLPNRTSLIISRKPDYTQKGCHTFTSIEQGIEFARENGEEELYIIGGGEIYRQTYNLIDKIYLTRVNETFNEADTFYPKINYDEWRIMNRKHFLKDDKNEYPFEFLELKKIKI